MTLRCRERERCVPITRKWLMPPKELSRIVKHGQLVTHTSVVEPLRGTHKWCQIYWCETYSFDQAHTSVLSCVEIERAKKYSSSSAKVRFLVGAILLRTAVSHKLEVDPRDVIVERGCSRCNAPHGKTRLPGTSLQASVAHSGSLVGVALGEGMALGLDIEQITNLDYKGLSKLVVAPSESPPRSARDFFCYWTRKESVVKATGDGLSQPLGGIVVSSPTLPPALIAYRNRPLKATMYDLSPRAGYMGAVTLLTEDHVTLVSHGIVDLSSLTLTSLSALRESQMLEYPASPQAIGACHLGERGSQLRHSQGM